jgi:hypothetical protein
MVEEKYSNIDPPAVIPKFEEFLARFQEKHSGMLYPEMYFPELASPEPVLFPEIKHPNILYPEDSIFKTSSYYSLAAICPLRSSLTIKIVGNNQSCTEPECENQPNYFEVDRYGHGWDVVDKNPNGYELYAQRQNALMVTAIFFYGNGNAILEYYENDSETPFLTRRIRWESP